MIEQHYTPEAVAEKLELSVDTIYRAMRRGDLVSVRPRGCRSRRIPQSALDRWMDDADESSVDAPVVQLSGRR